ncbi:hypothetical protein M407DRAFT_23195 [Tulasnella calospora MUT 4182]|uniref:Cytochrome P450 n=1 Tax=Tulasnella calospora MUT 4182 TaxID=1051891 RepID=A0A0C3QB35_9AGAM|nr:hypothetical protein M407DRAFT_23195 [Tulasnella calospora MUT 4182]
MKFKRDAVRWKKEIDELENSVFESIKENMMTQKCDIHSCSRKCKRSIRSMGHDAQQQYDDEMSLAHAGLQIFFGGLESTEATMQSLFRSMILFPAVQEKTQAEIDKVIGPDYFPTFKDQPDMPFLHAVILEALRWCPVATFGLPHVSIKDDVYEGYFIPRGTTVLANAWGFSRNPKYYTNPTVFDPERYLKESPELDPGEYVFGYGRRLCPGKDLTFQEVWILAASVLWAFNLVGVEDEPASVEDVDRFTFGGQPSQTFQMPIRPQAQRLKE